jgi:glycosyltransferase involved in cell wall biosynthesis
VRLLFCNYEYPPLGGGGGVVNALLAEELATRHDVTVLTSRAGGLPAESIAKGVRIVRLPVLFRRQRSVANLASMFGYMVAGATLGRRWLRANSFDVINTHFVLPSGPVGDALAHAARLPNVLSLHGGDLYDPSKWSSPHRHAVLRSYVRRLVRRADQLIVQSSDTLANLQRFYSSRLTAARIPLGILRPPPGVAPRARYGLGAEDVLLITVGRLVARKATDQLIDCLAGLGQPRIHLLVVGSGPEQPRLEQHAAHRGVLHRVHFLGHVTDEEKFQLLRMADIFVSSSQHEGFGLCFLEALACGLPIVCYDRGGHTDFLQTGITGALVPLNDLAELERHCDLLVRDAGKRADMGRNGIRVAEDYYIDVCARRYEAVFEETIRAARDGPPGPPPRMPTAVEARRPTEGTIS